MEAVCVCEGAFVASVEGIKSERVDACGVMVGSAPTAMATWQAVDLGVSNVVEWLLSAGPRLLWASKVELSWL